MGRTTPRGVRGLVGTLVVLGAIGAGAARAQEAPGAGSTGRLRPMDARAAALLREGAAESATFREIVWRLENSDLVIYIKVARLDHRGTVHFVAAAPSYRILCVTIQLPGLADAIPFLAHELQHAVEIGGEPEVRDEASLLRFYGRIGHGFRVGSTTEMETTAAQMVTVTVWKEMTAPVARR